ncbi:MAG TPA: hypothetical protein VEA99_00535 [Gemmatimonadaceae bacterium]|nr:hypothetical protein [Gemmatimonadaceae bacterium]
MPRRSLVLLALAVGTLTTRAPAQAPPPTRGDTAAALDAVLDAARRDLVVDTTAAWFVAPDARITRRLAKALGVPLREAGSGMPRCPWRTSRDSAGRVARGQNVVAWLRFASARSAELTVRRRCVNPPGAPARGTDADLTWRLSKDRGGAWRVTGRTARVT